MAQGEKQFLKVYVTGEPKVTTVVPKSGPNAGKDTQVLNVRVYQRHREPTNDGKFKYTEPTFYNLSLFGKESDQIASFLKDGMRLNVNGLVRDNEYEGLDGTKKIGKEILADNIGLDLGQKGMKSLEFVKTEKDMQAAQKAPLKAQEPKKVAQNFEQASVQKQAAVQSMVAAQTPKSFDMER